MKKWKQKTICILLAGAVAAGALPLTAAASGSEIISGTFQFGGMQAEPEAYYYSDGYFSRPSDEKNEHLITMSLILSLAPQGSGEGSDLTGLLSEIGYSDFRTDDLDVKPGRDTIGSTIAHKEVNGKDVVAVVVRGYEYEGEWASNLTCGASGDVQGISEAAGKITERVKAYIADNALDDVQLWVTGYSRAAGVADLTGVYVNNNLSEFSTTADDVYVFAYEPLRCSADPTVYDNIYCIKNKNDIVTYVYPESWGLYTNGVEVQIGDEASVSAYRIDTSIDSYVGKLENTPIEQFLKEFSEFLGTNITREAYSGACEQALATLAELFFSKDLSDWKPVLSYFTDEILPIIKNSNAFQYLLLYDAMAGIAMHNSDQQYERVVNDIFAVLEDAMAVSTKEKPFTDEEYATIRECVYPILRTFGPAIAIDWYTQRGNQDLSERIPASFYDAEYDPAKESSVYTYEQFKQIMGSGMSAGTQTDAERGTQDGRKAGEDAGYADGLNGTAAEAAEAVMPENADVFSAEYLAAYETGYVDGYSSGVFSGQYEAKKTDAQKAKAAAIAAAEQDAYLDVNLDPEHRLSHYCDVPADSGKYSAEYLEAYKTAYAEKYEKSYNSQLNRYDDIRLYHFITLVLNIKELTFGQHVGTVTFGFLQAMDSYYTKPLESTRNDHPSEQTETETEPEPIDAAPQVASDEDLCAWAVNDYCMKQQISAADVTASVTDKADGRISITVLNANGDSVAVYRIDAETGTGTDGNGKPVSLPQTGNGSLTPMMVVFGAFLCVAAGLAAVYASGVLRRRKEEDQ